MMIIFAIIFNLVMGILIGMEIQRQRQAGSQDVQG